jgi:hypothetical protein
MSAINTNPFSLRPAKSSEPLLRAEKGRRRDAREVATVLLPPDMRRRQLGWPVDDCFARRAATELVIAVCEKHSPAVAEVALLLCL